MKRLSILIALVEALKRVGRDLSREKLIQALEGFHDYATGLTPAITYSPTAASAPTALT